MANNYIPSPNMGLQVPIAGQETGPNYATDVNQSLNKIDSHNHSAGQGVQIGVDGLLIDGSLPFNSNSATGLTALTLVESTQTAIQSLYVDSSGALHYINGAGLDITITNTSGIAITPQSIPGLDPLTFPYPSAEYIPSSQKFVWQSASSIAANMDFGSAIMRNLSPNSTYALTLQPPAGLISNFSLTLPVLPTLISPNSEAILTIDGSGNIVGNVFPDNVTIANTSGNLGVIAGSITNTYLAANSVTDSNIVAGTITPDKLTVPASTVITLTNGTYANNASIPFSQTTVGTFNLTKNILVVVTGTMTFGPLSSTPSSSVLLNLKTGGGTPQSIALLSSALYITLAYNGSSNNVNGYLDGASFGQFFQPGAITSDPSGIGNIVISCGTSLALSGVTISFIQL